MIRRWASVHSSIMVSEFLFNELIAPRNTFFLISPGGEGSVVGTIVGALILTIISNAMNLMSVNAYLQQVVMGLIIIMAILFDMVRKGYIFRKPDEE